MIRKLWYGLCSGFAAFTIVLMFLLFYFLGAVIGIVLLILGATTLLGLCIYQGLKDHHKDKVSKALKDSADTSHDL